MPLALPHSPPAGLCDPGLEPEPEPEPDPDPDPEPRHSLVVSATLAAQNRNEPRPHFGAKSAASPGPAPSTDRASEQPARPGSTASQPVSDRPVDKPSRVLCKSKMAHGVA